MKASICIETIFTEYPFIERLQHVKEAGFEYAEFWSWDDKDLSEIKSECERLGLKIASFSGDKDYSLIDSTHNEKYLQYLTRSMAAANFLGCENLVIHSNALGEGGAVICDYIGRDKAELFSNMQKVLKDACVFARRSGINLVLEALNTNIDHVGNFLSSTEESVKAAVSAKSPNVKILYDIYHMQLMEGNIINTLSDYFEQIGYIHAADVPGRNEPGTGELNYGNIIKMLDALGYKGVVGFELFPKRASQEAINAIQKIMQGSGQ